MKRVVDTYDLGLRPTITAETVMRRVMVRAQLDNMPEPVDIGFYEVHGLGEVVTHVGVFSSVGTGRFPATLARDSMPPEHAVHLIHDYHAAENWRIFDRRPPIRNTPTTTRRSTT